MWSCSDGLYENQFVETYRDHFYVGLVTQCPGLDLGLGLLSQTKPHGLSLFSEKAVCQPLKCEILLSRFLQI